MLKNTPGTFCRNHAKSSAPSGDFSFFSTLSHPSNSEVFLTTKSTNSEVLTKLGIPGIISRSTLPPNPMLTFSHIALIFSFIRWRVSSFKVLSVPVNLTSSHIILPLCPPSIFPKEITAESVGSIFRLMML